MSMNILRKNLGLKLFSILLAIALWGYVKYTQSPFAGVSSQVMVRVPIKIVNLQEELVAANPPAFVDITVLGAPKTVKALRPQHFKAVLDTDEKGTGTYFLPVLVEPPPGIEVLGRAPAQVTLRLEERQSMKMPPSIDLRGKTAEGFLQGTPRFSPPMVTVSGGKTALSRVAAVMAHVDLRDANSDLIQQTEPIVVGKDGKPLSNVAVAPAHLLVTIPVSAEITTLVLPISPRLTGQPAPGWRLATVSVNPPTATLVMGKSDLPIPQAIVTEPVDLSAAEGKVSGSYGLVVPPGLKVVSGQPVQVTVSLTRGSRVLR